MIPISSSHVSQNEKHQQENIYIYTDLLDGPPLTECCPEKYVRSWLVKDRHSAYDTASSKREKKNFCALLIRL